MPKSYSQIGKKNIRSIISQVTYAFFILNEFIDFSESMWIFPIFLTFMKTPFLKKKIEACSKNISKICNYTFVFQNFQKDFWKHKEKRKTRMNSEKSINSFEIKKW